VRTSVLLVDDEKSFRVIAEAALLREGYAVRTAASGADGLAAWRQSPPDVMLLDRSLPDADGVDLLATLCQEARERGSDTLFLIITAYADVENAVSALRQGADDYLTKPIQLSELVVKVRKALEARHLRNRVRAPEFVPPAQKPGISSDWLSDEIGEIFCSNRRKGPTKPKHAAGFAPNNMHELAENAKIHLCEWNELWGPQ
jgi:DNA-binding response OmpR family regulator